VRLSNCHNFPDFRELARRRLPGPIFNYIDGAAEQQMRLRQRCEAINKSGVVGSSTEACAKKES
jgi:L-lactate dehydrogenase (cytochrome)